LRAVCKNIVSKLTIKDLNVAHIGPINLEIHPGEIVCLSGASGSGKSLMLRGIADIIPANGVLSLDEVRSTELPAPDWRRQVALLPAESQWWHDHIGEHFNSPDLELFMQLGFEMDCLDWQLSRCSTGEKQRLALLRVLENKPKCLLLDEPTGSLDPDNTLKVEAMLKARVKQQQIPLLWVSHSHEQINRVADRHFVMRNGGLHAYE